VKSVQNGIIGATSQQYPLKMAQLGVEAIAKYAKDKTTPTTSPGLDFFDTGVKLVTDKKVPGVDSITSAEGLKVCWG
jgi:fructose transport system substrate-binding protein